MAKKVLKFGGTSVGTIERILHVAQIIKKEHDSGNQVIAIVSAMSGKTNELLEQSQKISDKFNDLYAINKSEIPTDIQIMINNNESGAALLRIVEVIGQDKLERMDEDTLYFIISALNQLNIDSIRNKILLKVLPLKV